MPRSREEKDYMHSAIITKITKLFFPRPQIQADCSRVFCFFSLHGTVMKLHATDTRALGESNVFILG